MLGSFDTFMPIIIKSAYVYLLILSVYCFVKSYRLGISIDSTKITLNPLLYIMHLSVWWLSAIQIYQCVGLIMGGIGPGWWVPLVCKQGSLIAYVIFLNFIEYRHAQDVLERQKLTKICEEARNAACNFRPFVKSV